MLFSHTRSSSLFAHGGRRRNCKQNQSFLPYVTGNNAGYNTITDFVRVIDCIVVYKITLNEKINQKVEKIEHRVNVFHGLSRSFLTCCYFFLPSHMRCSTVALVTLQLIDSLIHTLAIVLIPLGVCLICRYRGTKTTTA